MADQGRVAEAQGLGRPVHQPGLQEDVLASGRALGKAVAGPVEGQQRDALGQRRRRAGAPFAQVAAGAVQRHRLRAMADDAVMQPQPIDGDEIAVGRGQVVARRGRVASLGLGHPFPILSMSNDVVW